MKYSNDQLIKAIVDYVNTVGEEEGVDFVERIINNESRKIIIDIIHDNYVCKYNIHKTYYHPKED